MASPTITASQSSYSSSGTSHTVTYPSGLTDGLLLIAVGASRGVAYTPAGGWELIYPEVLLYSDRHTGVWAKTSSASLSGTTESWSLSSSNAGTVQIIEASGTDPVAILMQYSHMQVPIAASPLAFTNQFRDYLAIALVTYSHISNDIRGATPDGWSGLLGSGATGSSAIQLRTVYYEGDVAEDVPQLTWSASINNYASMGWVYLSAAPDSYISGTVTLESPVLGANVLAINRDTGEVFGPVPTDENGDYSLPVISGSLYHVVVEYTAGEDRYHAYSLWDVEPV